MKPRDGRAVRLWRRGFGWWAGVLIVALTMMTVGPGDAGGVEETSSLWEGMRSFGLWVAAAVAAPPQVPIQVRGTAGGPADQVPASATRAGAGVGTPPGVGQGELSAYAPHVQPRSQRPIGGALHGRGHFDEATSRRVAKASTSDQDVFANADGSFTRRVYGGRVNYRGGDGTWQPIDTRFIPDGHGSYRVSATDVSVVVAGKASDSALVTVSTDAQHSVGFALAGATSSQVRVSGSVATYPKVFPGVDLVEEATPTGVKESLVLSSAAAGSTWTFPLSLAGLSARLAVDGSGAVEFVDATGAAVLRVPRGFMEDSKVDTMSGLRASSSGVWFGLEQGPTGSPVLRVSVDESWLKDPARVFPVVVDPTATFGTSGSTYAETLRSGAHNTEKQVEIGTYDAGTHKARSYLAFSGFESTYAGMRLTAASLTVFDTWATNCSATTSFSVSPVTSAWTPASVTAFPGPSVGAPIGSWSGVAPTVACSNTAGDRTVGANITTGPLDVTTFNGWVAGSATNYGLALTASESDSRFWKLFDSDNTAHQPVLNLTYTPDIPPQVDSQYPPDNYSTPTLTPELSAYGHDADQFPAAPKYAFTVFNSSQTVVASSGLIASNRWVVPAGSLTWGQSYAWTVQTYDGYSYSADPQVYELDTPVPQPLITSGLSQNTGGHGFEPNAGDYTAQQTDAQIATVGPPLTIERSYNSLDPRLTDGFGAGWSSVVDMRAVDVRDASNAVTAVVVTYPQGQEIAFGRNPDGSFVPPAGRFSTFAAVAGGYSLTDKDDTKYLFTQPAGTGRYGLTSITDASGRTEMFTVTGSQVTRIVSASGRALALTWTTPAGATAPHVASVSTDAAMTGNPATVSTWTYSYTGDQLTSVCQPTSGTACSKYSYVASTVYPHAVLGAGPRSYWRLGEASGATLAASAILTNEGVDSATYSNVALGSPGSLAGSSATSATFNGTSSAVALRSQMPLGSAYQSISLRFKTTATNGVLLSYQEAAITAGTTTGNFVPALYVGNDGKLLGEFWDGSCTPMSSPGPVNDGSWHEVVLAGSGSSQSLYLDGVSVGSKSGPIALFNSAGAANVYVGAGFLGACWPDESHAGTSGGTATFLAGSVSDVAFYDRALSAGTVADIAAAAGSRKMLSQLSRPSGSVYAAPAYDSVTGRLAQVTDDNGGVWRLNNPSASGSSQVYVGAILGAAPQDYWRLAEPAGTDALNQVNGDKLTYRGGVSLNGAGRFADQPSAAFDGASGYATPNAAIILDGGNQSISLWFKTTSSTASVLVGYHQDPLGNGSSAGNYVPLLYVGSDGKLRGEYFVPGGSTTPLTTATSVRDGAWHHVVLAANGTGQSLYLDNALVGTRAGTPAFANANTGANVEIGAGYLGGTWPGHSYGSNGKATYFAGSIAEVAVFRSGVTAAQVGSWWRAAALSGGVTAVVTHSVTDPAGKTLTYTYDATNGGRLLEQADGLANITRYGYDTGGFLYTVTDPNGNVVTTGHDVRGNTVSTKSCQNFSTGKCSTAYFTYFPDATTARLSPDARNDVMVAMRDGRSTSETDTAYLTTYGYDAAGNRTSVTTPPVAGFASGRTTTTTFTTATTAAVGGGTTPPGLPATTTTPGGATMSFGYFATGDLAQVSDPVGLVTSFTYDKLGRQLTQTVTSDTFPAGLVTSTSYDLLGRVISETDPGSRNAVTGVVHTARTVTVFDDDGNPTSQTVSDVTGADASRTTTTTYDAFDRVATITDPTGGVTTRGYDVYGNMNRQTDPTGARTDYVHDASGRLLTTTLAAYTGDPVNPTAAAPLVESSRAYDPAGRLATLTDSMGRVTSYAYTDNGLLSRVSRTFNGSTFVIKSMTYDAADNVVSTTTNNGTTVSTAVVDAAGRTTSTTLDPPGVNRTTTFTYTADDQVASRTVSDASGARVTSTSTYDLDGRELTRSVTGSVAPGTVSTSSQVLDTRGLPVSSTDEAGNTTLLTYDEAGLLVSTKAPSVQVESGGGPATAAQPTTVTGYDTFGEQTQIVDANGNRTTVAYDKSGRETSRTAPSYTPTGGVAIVATSTRSYDLSGQLTAQTDSSGHTTSYAYDQLGDLAVQTNPDTGVIHNVYDTNGELLSSVDPMGATVTATYDYLGRRLTSTQVVRGAFPAAYTTTTGYDNAGWMASVTSPVGVVTGYGHNAVGELTSVTDGAGNITRFGYDLAGRRVSTTAADATKHLTAYDDRGAVISQRDLDATGQLLRTQTFGYDLAGRMVSATDGRGSTMTYGYDALGRLVTQTQPVDATTSITTTFGYDAAGNRTRYTDGRGNPFITTYTSWNLPAAQIEPATSAYPAVADRTFAVTYDAGGRVVGATQPGGVSETMTYDVMGRLTRQAGAGADAATATRTFSYDLAGRVTASAVVGGPGTNSFGYDDRSLLVSTAGPSGSSTFTYDADARMTSRVDAAGTSTYSYDSAGRLGGVQDASTGAHLVLGYTAMSQVSQISYDGADVRRFSYDGLHRMTSDSLTTASGAVVASIGYGYDGNDNLTSKTTVGFSGSAAATYGYDLANRLVSVTNGGGPVTYGYDASGNRVRAGTATAVFDARDEVVSDQAGTYTYTPRGTLASVTSAGVTAAVSFDAFGQNVTAGARTMVYDGLGRLVSASGGGSSAAFSYSGVDNTPASDGLTVMSRDPGGSVIGTAVGGSAGVLVWTDQHTDVVAQFTASSSVLTGSTQYDPYGVVRSTSGMVGRVGFQSGWTDPVTARVDMAARWYDPARGGFISRDSVAVSAVGDPAAANPFGYVSDNPLDDVDPSGHCGLWSCLSSFGHAVSQGVHRVAGAAHRVYSAARVATARVVAAGMHSVTAVRHTVADAYHAVKQAAHHAYQVVHHATARVYRGITAHVHAALHAVATAANHAVAAIRHGLAAVSAGAHRVTAAAGQVGHQVAAAAGQAVDKAGKFLAHHAADIASLVVSTVVFAGCEAVVGIPTGGVGAIAGAAACGALAGAAGNIAAAVVDAAQHHTPLTASGLLGAGLSGAVSGAIGGALGSAGGQLISKGANAVLSAIQARIATSAAATAEASAVRSTLASAVSGCVAGVASAMRHSFSGATLVVLGDGSSKRIDQIRRGDRVLATNPGTGVTTARLVTHTWTHHDANLLDVSVTTSTRQPVTGRTVTRTSTLHTTATHPFYDQTRHAFIPAGQLSVGTRLHPPTPASTITVTAVTPRPGTAVMWDLTVDTDHDFYVRSDSTATATLVHNTNPGEASRAACGGVTDAVQKVSENADDAANTADEIPAVIYRGGGKSPSNFRLREGEDALSFRDSLSNPLPPGRPVMHPGKDWVGIDTSKLPPGSVVPDGVPGSSVTPPGHVSVYVDDPMRLKEAIIEWGKFPK